MPVSHSWEGPLLRLDLIGVSEPEEVIERFKAALADPDATRNFVLLLDTTRSESMATRTSAQIRVVADALKAYADRVDRCAVVAAQDIHYGLSRMGSVYTEMIGVETGVFRTEPEALDWFRAHNQ